MRCVAVVALLLALSGCGGDGDRGIADEAAGPLAERVAAVRVAAADGRAQALTELSALRGEVDRLLEQGHLSESAAERIRAAAEEVEAGLPSPPATTDTPPGTPPPTDAPTTTTTPPTTTTTTPPTTAIPPPQDQGGEDERDREEREDAGKPEDEDEPEDGGKPDDDGGDSRGRDEG